MNYFQSKLYNLINNMFVCLGFFVLLENFFTHMETSPLLVKGYKFWPMLLGPMTLTPIAKRLAVERSLPVFMTSVFHGWDWNTQPFACRANALTHCATAAAWCLWNITKIPIHIVFLIVRKLTLTFFFFMYSNKR